MLSTAYIDIDFKSTNDVYGYGHLLASQSRDIDMGNNDRYAKRDIIHNIKQWIDGFETNISTLPFPGLLQTLEIYDILHRIAYGKPPKSAFCDKWNEKIFGAWLHGDRSISEIDILTSLHKQLSYAPDKISHNRMLFFCQTIKDWIDESRHCGKFKSLSLVNALGRVSILLASDLFAYIQNQNDYKQKLLSAHSSLINSFEMMDGPTLKALFVLVGKLYPVYLPLEDAKKLQTDILRQLSSSLDLNRYDRDAYKLDFKFYKMMHLTS